MTKILIRKAKENEISAVGDFYDKVVKWLDEHINYPKWMYKDYPSERYAREMTSSGSQYICEDEGEIIGTFAFNDDPQADYQKGTWSCYIPDGSYMVLHAFALDPGYQGCGIGSEVVRFCIDEAKSRGYKAIRLDIVPENTPAAKLYEKNGFKYTGESDLGRGLEAIPLFRLYELVLEEGI